MENLETNCRLAIEVIDFLALAYIFCFVVGQFGSCDLLKCEEREEKKFEKKIK
jgi:hypothetical protein